MTSSAVANTPSVALARYSSGASPVRPTAASAVAFAGTVAAVGSRVRRFAVGDRVYAYAWLNPKGGFYAEYVAVPAPQLMPVPDGVDLVESAGLPEVGWPRNGPTIQ